MAEISGDFTMLDGEEGLQGKKFQARSYQQELFERACEDNTVVCLKTGAGKTFIAVMLIKELQHQIAKSFADGKRTFFMVPKVPLVEQQGKVVEAHTSLKVGKYYGEMGVDFWDRAKWTSELERHHVMVMTAQILVNLLQAGIMSMDKINLLIFDECHAATGNHPYCAIMARFQDFKEGPRILGLTAAIVNGKCPPSSVDLQMLKLEKALHCRIQTSNDLLSVARFSTKPREVLVVCPNPPSEPKAIQLTVERLLQDANNDIKPLLEFSKEEKIFNGFREYSSFQRLFEDCFFEDDYLNVCSETTKVLPSPHVLLKNVQTTLFTMGLWCTGFLIRSFIENIPKWRRLAEEQLKMNHVRMYDILYRAFLEVETRLRSALNTIPENRAIVEFATPKVQRLLELLANLNPDSGSYKTSFLESFRCIIFVECRITASVLSKYLTKVANVEPTKYQFLKPCFVVGHGCMLPFLRYASMTVDKQNETLDRFRSGDTNVMVATTVVEEGLDIPRCNVVVRFDPPKNFCSYVQSMGRARAESAIYVLLVELQNKKLLENDLATYKVIEDILQTRSHSRRVATAEETAEFYNRRKLVAPYYPKEKDGACVTMAGSLSILNMYTSHLKSDRYTVVKPNYKYVTISEGQIQCTITMPTGPLLHKPVTGASMPSLKEAKQAAGLEACVILHKVGELDDRLLPYGTHMGKYLAELGIVENEIVIAGAPIPGTKKRRLIYDKMIADELKNSYPEASKLVYLHLIRVIDGDDRKKSSFGILSTKRITKMCPFTIFTKSKFTIVVEQSSSIFVLTHAQIASVNVFHEVLFGDVLRLVSTSMAFKPIEAELSFVIVPIVDMNDDNFRIDWISISRCVNYKALCNVDAKSKERSVPKCGSVIRPLYGDESIRSKRFFVLKVLNDMTPMSEFSEKKEYNTYSNYFEAKYGMKVRVVDQPLVLVDYAPNSISLLTPSKSTGSPRKAQEMHLIPELCEELPVSREQYEQAFFLPSIIHRLNGLLLSKKLVDQIVKEADLIDNLIVNDGDHQRLLEDVYKNCRLDDAIIRGDRRANSFDARKLEASILYALFYQALTCRSAANWDDLERLELIGDSYLKYIVSVFLYCEFLYVNEGCLSTLRTSLVRNATLCHLAKIKKIPEMMNTSLFQPRINWLPPGYVIPEQLSECLSEARIPAHLWPFATMADIQLQHLYIDRYIWIDVLTDRWNKTDPGNKEAAQVAILEPLAALGDSGTLGQTLDVAYNHFTQQLVGDKSVADSMEALIGAVLLSCGQDAAIRLLKWFDFRLERRHVVAEDESDVQDGSFPWTRPKTAIVKPVSVDMQEIIYSRLDVLESKLNYRFRDKSFLRQAVVHSSYTKHPATDNYQRLEFLGDAILDFLITMNLYKKYPNMSPGDMTDLRSSLVDNSTFAFLSVKWEMHKHLRYNSLTLPQAIDNYLQHHSKLSHPKEAIYMYGEDEVLDLSDVEVPKALGDLFESIAGAIFVDSGFSLEQVWNVFHPIVKDLMDEYSKCLPINPIRKLVEHIPSSKFGRPSRVDENNYTVEVSCNDNRFVGRGRTKAVAKQAAAKCALRAMKLIADRKLNLG